MARHRKGKSANQLRRRAPRRQTYERFLIVCEGAKTEPSYFKELRSYYRLPTVDVPVWGEECRSDPVQVVKYAEQRFQEDRNFDRVYCVFDGDASPQRYRQALDRLYSLNLKRRGDDGRPAGKASLHAIPSVPCFELWLLLHHEFTDAPFGGAGSPCDQLIERLRRHLPDYRKQDSGIFERTRPRLDTALDNARQLQARHPDPKEDNPHTSVHDLVEAIINLTREHQR
ncbi:MAG: RloB family protein [Halorhodospira sp.]